MTLRFTQIYALMSMLAVGSAGAMEMMPLGSGFAGAWRVGGPMAVKNVGSVKRVLIGSLLRGALAS